MLLSISYLFQYTGFHNLAKCFKNACSKTILETKTYVEKRASVPVLHYGSVRPASMYTHISPHMKPLEAAAAEGINTAYTVVLERVPLFYTYMR